MKNHGNCIFLVLTLGESHESLVRDDFDNITRSTLNVTGLVSSGPRRLTDRKRIYNLSKTIASYH